MEAIPYLALISAIAGLILAGYYYTLVKQASPGNERMVFLMTEIQKGAKAFLKKEYQWVSVFVVAMAILLAIVIDPLAAVTYLLGAVLSASAGYAGMTVATMANARTTEDSLTVTPGPLRGAEVETYDDHRMAMAFALAGLRVPGVVILDPACVSKTWPDYFSVLERL